jgi:hypothetical protein
MNSGIWDRDSGQSAKVAGLSQNRCPVYRGMAVRIIPESVAGLLRNMQKTPSNVKPERSAAARDGPFNELHFHSNCR